MPTPGAEETPNLNSSINSLIPLSALSFILFYIRFFVSVVRHHLHPGTRHTEQPVHISPPLTLRVGLSCSGSRVFHVYFIPSYNDHYPPKLTWLCPTRPSIHDIDSDGRTYFFPHHRRLPLPADHPHESPPSYSPPYTVLKANQRRAFITLVSPGTVTDDVWIVDDKPIDVEGRLVQLYLCRFVVINGSHIGKVVGYGVPRQGYAWISVQLLDTLFIHAMLVKEIWIEEQLLSNIDRREGNDERQVFWD
jgi:hypothetical protein